MTSFHVIFPFIAVILSSFCLGDRRELKLEFFGKSAPAENYANFSLAHVAATGPHDVLHHFWAATPGGISLLIALADLNSTVNVSWPNATFDGPRKIDIFPEPTFSFGIVFPELVEFKDVADNANLAKAPQENVTYFNMRDFQWRGMVLDDSSDTVKLSFDAVNWFDSAGNQTYPFRSESLVFQITVSGEAGRGSKFPHLGHSMNCSEIEVRFAHLNLPSMTNLSRLALPVTVMSSDDLMQDPTQGIRLQHYFSLDDEYSPGVFKLAQLGTSNVEDDEPGGFMVWRPVAYLTDVRDFNDATSVVNYDLKDVRDKGYEHINETVLFAFYGTRRWDDHHVQTTNISFGLTEDGYFFGTNYTVWNVVVGYGSPPKDEFSTLILTAIIVGVLVPAGVTVAGGLFVIIKKLLSRGAEVSDIRNGVN